MDMERELGMTRDVFGKYLEGVISNSIRPIGGVRDFEVRRLDGGPALIMGTNSNTYEVTVSDYTAQGGAEIPTKFVLKVLTEVVGISRDTEDITERFAHEAGILRVTDSRELSPFTAYPSFDGRGVKLFPTNYSSSDPVSAERRMFLLEALREPSVYEIFSKLAPEQVNLGQHVVPALFPAILLHERLQLFAPQIDAAVKPEMIAPFDDKQYTERFLGYQEGCTDAPRKNWPPGVEDKIGAAIQALSTKHLTPERNRTFVQHNAYPWHSTTSCLMDSGDVRKGARSLHLGTLLGERSIFQKLPKHAFDALAREYIERTLRLREDLKQPPQEFKLRKEAKLPISEKEKTALAKDLADGMYLGAVFSNSRLWAGLNHYKNGTREDRRREIDNIRQVTHNQATRLAERDLNGAELLNGLEELRLFEEPKLSGPRKL